MHMLDKAKSNLNQFKSKIDWYINQHINNEIFSNQTMGDYELEILKSLGYI